MDASTASPVEHKSQAASKDACCAGPPGPLPSASGAERELLAAQPPDHVPGRLVVARIPDVDADDLRDEPAADQPRDGRLLSQRVSLKLLVAGGVLLVVVAVAPFFWPRDSRNQDRADGLPEWHPGPPAPTAQTAPAWNSPPTAPVQPDWQVQAETPEKGLSAQTSPGRSEHLCPGLTGRPPDVAIGPQPKSPPYGAAVPPEVTGEQRLHVLSPPSAPYGSPEGSAGYGSPAPEGATNSRPPYYYPNNAYPNDVRAGHLDDARSGQTNNLRSGWPEDLRSGSPNDLRSGSPNDLRSSQSRAGSPQAGEFPGTQMSPGSASAPYWPSHSAGPGASQYRSQPDTQAGYPYDAAPGPAGQAPGATWSGNEPSRQAIDGGYDPGPRAQQALPPGQSTYAPSGYYPGAYDPGNNNPGSYNPGNYNPANYNSSSYNPGNYNPGSYNPANYNPGSYNPSGYDPSSYNATGYNRSGYNPSAYGLAGAPPAPQAANNAATADRRASVAPYPTGYSSPSAGYPVAYPADHSAAYAAERPEAYPAARSMTYDAEHPGVHPAERSVTYPAYPRSHPGEQPAEYPARYPVGYGPVGYGPADPSAGPTAQGFGSAGARLEGTIERPEVGGQY